MLRGLETLSSENSQRQLKLFILEKRKLWGNLMALSSTKREPIRKMGINYLAGPVLVREMALNSKRVDLD